MSAGWVAGAIRGRSLAGRRLGDDGIRDLAAKGSLSEALQFLADTSYGHRVRADLDLVGAQRAVAETGLWHLRVLSGWLPPGGVRLVGVVAGWFELQNIESHVTQLAVAGGWSERPHALGVLSTAWTKVAGTKTPVELRGALANSEWGDPGGTRPADVFFTTHVSWARRLRDVVPQARAWSDGGIALATAKAVFAGPGSVSSVKDRRVPELGNKWRDAADLSEFARLVPPSGRWVLAEVAQPQDLWDAERRWWLRVDHDAATLLRRPWLDRVVVAAAATLLLTDCWRTQSAIERAARGTSVPETGNGVA